MKSLEELPIPAAVLQADQKAELARVWLADGDQAMVISSRLWADPGVWGVLLVDMARHVANAYTATGVSGDEALQRIRSAFDAEWAHATGVPAQEVGDE